MVSVHVVLDPIPGGDAEAKVEHVKDTDDDTQRTHGQTSSIAEIVETELKYVRLDES